MVSIALQPFRLLTYQWRMAVADFPHKENRPNRPIAEIKESYQHVSTVLGHLAVVATKTSADLAVTPMTNSS